MMSKFPNVPDLSKMPDKCVIVKLKMEVYVTYIALV